MDPGVASKQRLEWIGHGCEQGRWQVRADRNFQGFGRVTVDREGRYRFRTIRPVAYSGRTPHIHVKVRLDRKELLTTQLYVEGDPHNERDFLWRNLGDRRGLVTVPFKTAADGLHASFPIVVTMGG